MVSSINTNIAAYSAQGNIGKASNSAAASIARLSSGNRITKASDDVAALSIGTSLRTQVTTLKTALNNASQGSSLLQVADGALSQISEILQRQKAIATQAGSGSLGATERGFLNQEFQNLAAEIDRISNTTNFNGVKLLSGGLGTSSTLASTSALAALFVAGANQAASVNSIGSFDKTDGSVIATAAAGSVEFVDAAGTAITDAAFANVNKSLGGAITDFKLTNLIADVAATISVKIGGVEYTGTYADAATDVTLSNGNTYLKLTMTTAIGLANAGTAQAGLGALRNDYQDTVILRTGTIEGVDFSGTKLQTASGLGTTGIAMARVSDPSRLDISNFQYSSNAGADANVLTVQVNGKTFTVTGVSDAIDETTVLSFESGDGEGLQIDLTGIVTADGDGFVNIRTSANDQAGFINALNAGFGRAGSGLAFQVGATSSDSLRVSLSASTTTNLYGGQALSVASAEGSATAVTALDAAISKVTALRADVGAIQSRFNFASANLETSIQNQDAARGALLDTDVAGESTAYATAQVQLQAGIAVLAQANQLPQNLLKLIS